MARCLKASAEFDRNYTRFAPGYYMAQDTNQIEVYLEIGQTRAFAAALAG